MRHHLAEAIRLNGLPEDTRRAAIRGLKLGSRTVIAVLAKHLQGRTMKSIATRAHRSVRGE